MHELEHAHRRSQVAASMKVPDDEEMKHNTGKRDGRFSERQTGATAPME